jgi:putative NADH-flavin reductase
MKIAIFGASRGIGLQLVAQALELGHQVTGFARSFNPVFSHANLTLLEGNALSPAAVEIAVKGQEAVVVALGEGNKSQSHVRSIGTHNVIQSMEQQGVSRLVVVSSFGVGDSRKGFMANMAWLFLKAALSEHELQEKAILESQLDFTIVRPTGLTDEPKTGVYQIGSSGRGRIARADVADFILKVLPDPSWYGKTPMVSS